MYMLKNTLKNLCILWTAYVFSLNFFFKKKRKKIKLKQEESGSTW